MLRTSIGQQLDMMTAPAVSPAESHRVDLTRFTETRYSQIVRYKTAYYSFCLPVEAALAFSQIVSDSRAIAALASGQAAAKELHAMLVDMGELFQIQDDVLDCFGDSATTGKVGTDIADGKCSWLAVQALRLASDTQRLVLQQHFGRPQTAHVDAVRNVYCQLQLDRLFAEHERRAYDALLQRIAAFRIQSSCDAAQLDANEQLAGRLRTLFVSLLNRTFKRTR